MAEIKDCAGKKVKISKHSITIKNDEGKTCGVVRNIINLKDIQPNMQFEYWHKLKKAQAGTELRIDFENCIIKDNKMYVFRNIKHQLAMKKMYIKFGFLHDDEWQMLQDQTLLYDKIRKSGIDVIECIFV